MENWKNIRQFTRGMQQARAACEEAWSLLEENGNLRLVANSLYHIYYATVMALLHSVGAGPSMEPPSVAQLEQLFGGTGIIDERFFPLIRRAFDLRPKHPLAAPLPMNRTRLVAMLQEAQSFYLAVTAAAEQGLLDGLTADRRGLAVVINA